MASKVNCMFYPIGGIVDTMHGYGIPMNEGDELHFQDYDLDAARDYALSCTWESSAHQWIHLIHKTIAHNKEKETIELAEPTEKTEPDDSTDSNDTEPYTDNLDTDSTEKPDADSNDSTEKPDADSTEKPDADSTELIRIPPHHVQIVDFNPDFTDDESDDIDE